MKPAEVVMPAKRADFGRRTGATGLEPANDTALRFAGDAVPRLTFCKTNAP
jgi:hypothetical protein